MNIPTVKAESCKNCKHRFEENGQLFCALYPPTVAFVTQNSPGGLQSGWASSLPPVPPDLKCGQYARGIIRSEMT